MQTKTYSDTVEGRTNIVDFVKAKKMSHETTFCQAVKVLVGERIEFIEKLREISPSKYKEFQLLPETLKSAWLLGGGTCREANPFPVSNNRIAPLSSPLQKGNSVNPVKDKADPAQCLEAYAEYREILDSLEKQHLRVYTDGSRSTKSGLAGYGLRIISRNKGDERVIRKRDTRPGSLFDSTS